MTDRYGNWGLVCVPDLDPSLTNFYRNNFNISVFNLHGLKSKMTSTDSRLHVCGLEFGLGDGFEFNDNQSETQDGTSGLYPLIFAVILIVLEVRL